MELIIGEWILDIIHYIKISKRPPCAHFVKTGIPSSQEKSTCLHRRTNVEDLTATEAIYPVLAQERGMGMYSPLFIIGKA